VVVVEELTLAVVWVGVVCGEVTISAIGFESVCTRLLATPLTWFSRGVPGNCKKYRLVPSNTATVRRIRLAAATLLGPL